MKTRILFFVFAPVFFVQICCALTVYAQCSGQVTHKSGASIVSGVNVHVTSTGSVDSLVYCASGVAGPYWVGQHNLISGNGSYSFSFSPPVSGVSLNFGAVSNAFGNSEEVEIYVNGVHYAVQSLGNPSGCEPMAVITGAGNITSCNNCPGTGCKDLNIFTTISNLTVSNVIITGDPAGSVFALFICDSTEIGTGVDDPENGDAIRVYPNPLHSRLNITTGNNRRTEVALFDLQSRKLLQEEFINTISINTEHFANGIYFYELRSNNGVIRKGKVSKE